MVQTLPLVVAFTMLTSPCTIVSSVLLILTFACEIFVHLCLENRMTVVRQLQGKTRENNSRLSGGEERQRRRRRSTPKNLCFRSETDDKSVWLTWNFCKLLTTTLHLHTSRQKLERVIISVIGGFKIETGNYLSSSGVATERRVCFHPMVS